MFECPALQDLRDSMRTCFKRLKVMPYHMHMAPYGIMHDHI